IPGNFEQCARVTDSDVFVIEADEYDTAFFDKRAKFVHYHSDVLVINNLEFDHADIYQSLSDIQKQFHHVIRTIPSQGRIICPKTAAIEEVLAMGK
ncbi:Mur ligase family protein, partial [Klebsiella pneumoniae]|uniref:Mur ligase family protein n=1 Tax=Klebsiella pneumoniae TaxID=573 RepID=UPI0021F78EDA